MVTTMTVSAANNPRFERPFRVGRVQRKSNEFLDRLELAMSD